MNPPPGCGRSGKTPGSSSHAKGSRLRRRPAVALTIEAEGVEPVLHRDAILTIDHYAETDKLGAILS